MSGQPFVLVFDLDDTLYLERDFAFSGFRAAGDFLERQTGVAGLAHECRRLFEEGARGDIFDAALIRLGLTPAPDLVAGLVSIYRTHPPAISLAPDARRYLNGTGGPGRPFAMITDGVASTQAAKVIALGLDSLIEEIVLTDSLGPGYGKPHPAAFARVEKRAGVPTGRLAYVGDNPLKDFVTPRARGWLTVAIARSDRVHRVEPPDANHAAHGIIESLDDLDALLTRHAAGRPAPDLRSLGMKRPGSGQVRDIARVLSAGSED